MKTVFFLNYTVPTRIGNFNIFWFTVIHREIIILSLSLFRLYHLLRDIFRPIKLFKKHIWKLLKLVDYISVCVYNYLANESFSSRWINENTHLKSNIIWRISTLWLSGTYARILRKKGNYRWQVTENEAKISLHKRSLLFVFFITNKKMTNRVFGYWMSLGLQSPSNEGVSSSEQHCEPPLWITYYFSRSDKKLAGG